MKSIAFYQNIPDIYSPQSPAQGQPIYTIMKKILCATLLLAAFYTQAQVRLPQLVSDGMILQRDAKLNIWGWARPGEKVSIAFKGKTYKTITDNKGNWLVKLPPTATGGPYTMDISASNHITLHDILVGDVWFCSGQSNMVFEMARETEMFPDDIAQAANTPIRNFFVPTLSDVTKLHTDLPPGKWTSANAETILHFGAVSYFMAKQLFEKYHVPIGIINSSVGGTPIQAWISEDGFKNIPQYYSRVQEFKDTATLNKILYPAVVQRSPPPFRPVPDKGLSEAKKWYDPTYVPDGWHPYWLPGYWADQGVHGLNGTVWFRKEIDLPAAMAGQPAKLFMGRVVDADYAYINGVLCGNTTYQYPPRRYPVAAGVLKAGKNIIVIKVISTAGKGGFVPGKRYELRVGDKSIDLRGDWQYKVGNVFDENNTPRVRPSFSAQNEPTGLYNTMVAPAINYTVKGFVWYQGEANSNKPQEYAQLLPALITNWRAKWNQGSLPFIYAQLPNYMEVNYSPSESGWAELREGQLKSLSVPNTAMAVTIDAGEWNDIHPTNKKTVGERLALGAERLAYGETNLIASGPVFESAKVDGSRIVITFSHTGSGLTAKGGGELAYFAVAGSDKKFIWANAVIEGNTVVLSNPEVPHPMYVRYAWADNPDGANLYNKEGLPASPFRTDGQ
jgi:sialate O-acetylesterase